MSVGTQGPSRAPPAGIERAQMGQIPFIVRNRSAFKLREERAFVLLPLFQSNEVLGLFGVKRVFAIELIDKSALHIADNSVGGVFDFEVRGLLGLLERRMLLILVREVLAVEVGTHLLGPEIAIGLQFGDINSQSHKFISDFYGQPVLQIQKTRLTYIFHFSACVADFSPFEASTATGLPAEHSEGSRTYL